VAPGFPEARLKVFGHCAHASSRRQVRAKSYRLSPEGKKALAAEEGRWERYVEAVAKIAPHGTGRQGIGSEAESVPPVTGK